MQAGGVTRADTWLGAETSAFHEHATFCGIWILVVLVGVHTMGTLRPILEPLIWAFFLMMALLPFTDLVEYLLLRAGELLQKLLPGGGLSAKELRAEAEQLERQYTGMGPNAQRMVNPEECTVALEGDEASASDDSGGRSDDDGSCGAGCVRTIAVLVTIVVFVGGAALFVRMIYNSASHMRSVWPNYEKGAKRLLDNLSTLKSHVPESLFDRVTSKTLESMEEVLSFLLGAVVEHLTSAVIEMLMTLLYMIFWLCRPVFVGETVAALFKRYILLKTLASFMYAICIYLLLVFLEVDLAIVFGLITFLFNFVPEVGTIAAMLLPVPVILFDGRLDRPLVNVAMALGGQFCLKFIFANIVEVKLVERQSDFRMHPVTILFFVAFFGALWGPTGMLVSVPIMAAVKAAVQVIPPTYRDPILVFLEGDKDAPRRYREALRRSK